MLLAAAAADVVVVFLAIYIYSARACMPSAAHVKSHYIENAVGNELSAAAAGLEISH